METYLDNFTLNRETTPLKYGLPDGYSLHTTGKVDTNSPGVYSVGITVIYAPRYEGNIQTVRKYAGYTKLIVVVEG